MKQSDTKMLSLAAAAPARNLFLAKLMYDILRIVLTRIIKKNI